MEIQNLGSRPYREVWERQRTALQELVSGSGPEVLFICSHPPVITMGKSAKVENLLAEPETLEKRGVEVIEVERGGDVTYHGPGQLVLYPILDLTKRKRDVGWYMRLLEEIVVRTLGTFGLPGIRVAGKTGVWIGGSGERKIASLGVKLSRWCSMHGLSLNIGSEMGALPLLEGFSLINPCGFAPECMTDMSSELGRPLRVAEVEPALTRNALELLRPLVPS